ncbi:hypothetical protein [Microbacterium sp. NPDC056569]|uniref:hypothetical protein n=1 Tax=Microbacterium sp. NPDC056569 TaxID=3345867 RepID=UPI0036720496
MTADTSAEAGPPARRRPVVVTISVVLVYVSAFAAVLLGILVLLSRYEAPRSDVLPVSLLGAGIILFGLLLVAVASGIARGSRLSRLLATGYLAILIVLNAVTIATTDGWDWSTAVQLAIEVLILVALWFPPGSRHFRRTDADADQAAASDRAT